MLLPLVMRHWLFLTNKHLHETVWEVGDKQKGNEGQGYVISVSVVVFTGGQSPQYTLSTESLQHETAEHLTDVYSVTQWKVAPFRAGE